MNCVYLDNAATTKPDEELVFTACKRTTECYYNPSALYREGLSAKKLFEEARNAFSPFLFGRRMIFTSCGTEADNTAMFSFAKKGNVVTTAGEHAAVYKSCELLKQRGTDVRYASLDYGGGVNEDDLLSKVDENTSLVSVVHVNNETGAINDINKLAKEVKKKAPRAVFMSDGVQGFLKIPFSLSSDVDLYSVSAHKIKAIKGTGALFFNEKLRLAPYLIGGGQQDGLRSGTEGLLGIYDFALAFRKYYPLVAEHYEKAKELKKLLLDRLDMNRFTLLSPENSSPYVISLSARGTRGAVLQNMLDDEGVIIGTGSACSSKSPHSRVISAFERDKKTLDGAIRLSFIYDTTKEDVIKAAEVLNQKANQLYGKINL